MPARGPVAIAGAMRVIKLALLTLALLPTVYLRSPKPNPINDPRVALHDLMPALRAKGPLPSVGQLQLVGAWQLTSRNRLFGSFSGLAQAGGALVAVSDRGAVMGFGRPGHPGIWRSHLTRLVNADWRKHHFPTDAESVASDPRSGDLLVGYEDTGVMERFSADLAKRTFIPLPVLREWPENQGPEAMTRLADGRTVIIGEVYSRWFDRTRHVGLVFPGEPRPNETPVRFEVRLPAGFRPCELTQMPDGRLLVLGRSFSFAGFRSVIAIFAPSEIQPDASITPEEIARIADPRIADNFEGMTAMREPDGSAAIWLISDSNEMVWAQRTLVLKLRLAERAQ